MDITEDSLYKYFRGKASREEKIAISEQKTFSGGE